MHCLTDSGEDGAGAAVLNNPEGALTGIVGVLRVTLSGVEGDCDLHLRAGAFLVPVGELVGAVFGGLACVAYLGDGAGVGVAGVGELPGVGGAGCEEIESGHYGFPFKRGLIKIWGLDGGVLLRLIGRAPGAEPLVAERVHRQGGVLADCLDEGDQLVRFGERSFCNFGLVGFPPEVGVAEFTVPREERDHDLGDFVAGVDPAGAVQVRLHPVLVGGAVQLVLLEHVRADELPVDDGLIVHAEQVGGAGDVYAANLTDGDALLDQIAVVLVGSEPFLHLGVAGGADGGFPGDAAVGFGVSGELVDEPAGAVHADFGGADAFLEAAGVGGDGVGDDVHDACDGDVGGVGFCLARPCGGFGDGGGDQRVFPSYGWLADGEACGGVLGELVLERRGEGLQIDLADGLVELRERIDRVGFDELLLVEAAGVGDGEGRVAAGVLAVGQGLEGCLDSCGFFLEVGDVCLDVDEFEGECLQLFVGDGCAGEGGVGGHFVTFLRGGGEAVAAGGEPTGERLVVVDVSRCGERGDGYWGCRHGLGGHEGDVWFAAFCFGAPLFAFDAGFAVGVGLVGGLPAGGADVFAGCGDASWVACAAPACVPVAAGCAVGVAC